MTTYYEPLVYSVPPEDDGQSLHNVLRNRMGVSRKLLSRLKLTERGITVNGERRYTSVKVRAGDNVELRMSREESDDILPQPMALDILYEDEQLLILNKAAGVIVHPTHGHYTDTLANGVVHMWKERGDSFRFRPVHRLDRETSGVLAVAKNAYVHQHISEQMQARSVTKEYVALVHGVVEQDEGTIDAPIDRDPDHPHFRIVTPSGYPAVTRFRAERRFHATTLVRLWLESGRTHQIRVHMRHIGHPLVGDRMYGPGGEADLLGVGRGQAHAAERRPEAEAAARQPEAEVADRQPQAEAKAALAVGGGNEEAKRHALHAERLGFVHPGTGERMTFTAPMPDDMAAMIGRWSASDGRDPD